MQYDFAIDDLFVDIQIMTYSLDDMTSNFLQFASSLRDQETRPTVCCYKEGGDQANFGPF